MKHAILTDNGNTYATVYKEAGLLCIALPKYPGMKFVLDAQVIPQLLNILKELQDE